MPPTNKAEARGTATRARGDDHLRLTAVTLNFLLTSESLILGRHPELVCQASLQPQGAARKHGDGILNKDLEVLWAFDLINPT